MSLTKLFVPAPMVLLFTGALCQAANQSMDPCAAGGTSLAIAAVDSGPWALGSQPPLRSPHALAMAGVTADVIVAYDVGPSGGVDACSIRIVAASRTGFAAAAKEHVARLRFSPALKDGVPVRAVVQDTLRFRERSGDRGRHHVF